MLLEIILFLLKLIPFIINSVIVKYVYDLESKNCACSGLGT